MESAPKFCSGKEFSYENLKSFTDNFNDQNFIGRTQFGRLYRGKIPQGWEGMDEKDATVKMWQNKVIIKKETVYWTIKPDYLLDLMKDEIKFLGLPFLEGHQNVVKVVGYCFEEEKLGVVYDLKPLDAVRNIVYFKEKFGWLDSIKVAIGLARLLELLHFNAPQYLVRNLAAAHVLVDHDFNPVVSDFAMVHGDDIGDVEFPGYQCPLGSHGYIDDSISFFGVWTDKTDVYTFGIILLELLTTCSYDSMSRAIGSKHHVWIDVHARGILKYARDIDGQDAKFSLAHPNLQSDPDYDDEVGTDLTMLALSCIDYVRDYRPDMKEVVSKLEKPNALKNRPA